jgi:hypothetical protein
MGRKKLAAAVVAPRLPKKARRPMLRFMSAVPY